MKPWELNKDPEKKDRLATVLYHLAESVAHAAVMLSPILPDAAAKLAAQLNLTAFTTLDLSDLRWGLLAEGHVIDKPTPVFPKIVIEVPTA